MLKLLYISVFCIPGYALIIFASMRVEYSWNDSPAAFLICWRFPSMRFCKCMVSESPVHGLLSKAIRFGLPQKVVSQKIGLRPLSKWWSLLSSCPWTNCICPPTVKLQKEGLPVSLPSEYRKSMFWLLASTDKRVGISLLVCLAHPCSLWVFWPE